MTLFFRTYPESLAFACDQILRLYPERFAPDGQPVDCTLNPDLGKGASKLALEGGVIHLQAGDRRGALRAIGHLMGAACTGTLQPYEEAAPFITSFGTMLDCSRNAVPTVSALKEWILKTSLMGYTSMMLYMEDVYPLESEPFFGYLRGGYSKADLKAVDDYAAALGVELFPAIQTLGHFEQFLQWPAAWKYQDTGTILCALTDETYDLLRRCLNSLSECFRSRRINLGMDEAFGLGEGAFKHRVGTMSTVEIMNRHWERVRALCADLGLQPMIWSDMYFRAGSKTQDYYDPNWSIDEATLATIPQDVQLCFWDYYHLEQAHYEKFLRLHQKMSPHIVFAGTAWVSHSMWSALSFAERSLNAAIPACRACGITEIFLTLWGDDGSETDHFTALPALQHAAEWVYAPAEEGFQERRAAHLLGSCNLRYADWAAADKVNTNAWFPDQKDRPSGAEKNFFWEDPILPIFQAQCPKDPLLCRHYEDLARTLIDAAKSTPQSAFLAYQAYIAKALSVKLGLYDRIQKCLTAHDYEGVRKLVHEDLQGSLLPAVQKAWSIRRDQWLAHNHPIGWEVVDARFAALCSRIEFLANRLLAWSRQELPSLPEFETTLHPLSAPGSVPPAHLQRWTYSRIKTPSFIK